MSKIKKLKKVSGKKVKKSLLTIMLLNEKKVKIFVTILFQKIFYFFFAERILGIFIYHYIGKYDKKKSP